MNFIGCSTIWVLIQVLTGIAAQSSVDEPWCPVNWEANGDHCYNLEWFPLKSWTNADESCYFLYPSNFPRLATIHSDPELIFVSSMLRSIDTFTWIGLQRHTGNSYTNTDGTTQEYFYWASGEPSLENSCVGLNPPASDGTPSGWYTENCAGLASYVCKMNKLDPLPACPDGGEEWGDSCYSFYPDTMMTKQQAEEECAAERKNLVSIESEEENNHVSQNIPDEAWLGLDKNTETGEWDWSDPGANYDDYNAWDTGFPNDDSGCAVINAQLKKWMNPSYCSNHTSRVVCKGARGGTVAVTAGTFVIGTALLLLEIFQI